MASPITRSTRRTKGLSTRSATMNNVAVQQGNHHNHYNTTEHSHLARKKRSRESIEDSKQLLSTKRARIAIEIESRPKAIPKTRSLVIRANATPDNFVSPPPAPHPTVSKAPQIDVLQPVPQQATRKPTNHQDKVANGIKHELDRLQPNSADLKGATRKLRSEGGTRFKSELSQYFPEYDEVIGNEPKEDHILNIDTPIIIVDKSNKTQSKQPPSPRKADGHPRTCSLKEFPDSLFYDIYDAHRVDFSFMDKNYKEEGGGDPLPDEYFDAIHRKPERQEKSIRNTDRGRAQHEKDQVIRLLEGLQGHDWLKLMGVSGITDSRKKDYEPARAHFIKGCEQIIEKFRIWRDEERRRKLEREQAMAEAEEDEEVDSDDEVEQGKGDEFEAIVFYDEEDDGNNSDGDPPDYSDIDASAARQLHEEAIARSKSSSRVSTRRTRLEYHPIPTYEVQKEFKSFFTKPYLREAALGKHRRSGRSVSAWGRLVPEVVEQDFDLPDEFRDDETLKVHARRRRRDRRISKS